MLTKGHYWILDALSTGGVRLDWLLRDPAALEVNYFTGPHPFSEPELTVLLMQLAEQQLVEIRPGHRYAFAFLTAAGGREWESWAEPDWSLYFEDVWEHTFSDSVERYADRINQVAVSASNKVRLQEAIIHVAGLDGSRILGRDCIQEESPWELFGWKTVPTSYTQCILLRKVETADQLSPRTNEEIAASRRFRLWCRRGFNPRQCFELETRE